MLLMGAGSRAPEIKPSRSWQDASSWSWIGLHILWVRNIAGMFTISTRIADLSLPSTKKTGLGAPPHHSPAQSSLSVAVLHAVTLVLLESLGKGMSAWIVWIVLGDEVKVVVLVRV